MADYEVPSPNTMLLRVLDPLRADAALRMLDRCLGAGPAELDDARVCTLSDVSSDGRLAPVAAGLLVHRPAEPSGWLSRVAVDVPFRRRGLGRRLLAEVRTTLRAEGARRLFVHVPAHAPAAHALLAAEGFTDPGGHLPPGCPSMTATSGNEPPGRWLVSEL